jgi:RNA polymerase primary sigma factor
MANVSQARSSWLSRYVQAIKEYPRLTKAEEHALARRMARPTSNRADHDLILSNLGFVVKIAMEYRASGVAFEDLLNEGNLGLIEAARHFDPRHGTKFITYAVWWIRKAILKAVAEHSAVVRVPRYQLKQVRLIRKTGHALSRELGREADREEISRELRVSLTRLDAVLQMKMLELSLDDKVGRDRDTSISDQLIDRQSSNPEAELMKAEHHDLIRTSLRRLSDLERVVIVNRFGLEGGPTFTLREIGAKLGVSRERVRQVEGKAMRRLRKVVARPARVRVIARGSARRAADQSGRVSSLVSGEVTSPTG